MDAYVQSMMEDQMASLPYLDTQFDIDPTTCSMPDPNSVASSMRSELFEHFMSGSVSNFALRSDRSLSYSAASSQSLSPQPQHQQPTASHRAASIFPAQMYNHSLESISPSTSIPLSNDEPSDEDHKVERRRAQNRAAQRAYRQRKDQSLKQREKEIEKLRDELEKAQRLNASLCKVVAVLRERLKEPNEEVEEQ